MYYVYIYTTIITAIVGMLPYPKFTPKKIWIRSQHQIQTGSNLGCKRETRSQAVMWDPQY